MCNENNLYQCDGCGKLVLVGYDEIVGGMTGFILSHYTTIQNVGSNRDYNNNLMASSVEVACNGSFRSVKRTSSFYQKLEWFEFG